MRLTFITNFNRILYLVIGIAISALLFNVDVIPSSPSLKVAEQISDSTPIPRRITFKVHAKGSYHVNIGGKIPLGLKEKSQRVLVTGGVGFVGSHLVDRLMAREPLLLEVDQIYHLACPGSPVHYKYNPVKTIISLYSYTN
ncbi:unnamed protein product [Lactuca virosa]|uniref:NAD-dependent epimerase/dehydratase domain-containing protein n=1 Tax=Lactuca virosa TaxID=75947 RepID=A0AAU9PUZ1_9ASTR|nr:unnamed protein product [Lactuca virosa]